MASPNHLVIVCGHAIWLGGPKNGYDEAEWLIESYKAGETPTFIEHIKAGVGILAEDERSVVMFSGGPTRQETPLSEARSYANLAAANGYFGFVPPHQPATAHSAAAEKGDPESHPLSPVPLHPRVMVEERALDSYHNILFSLLQFWRNHDCALWPERVTIVSHGFKRTRLVDSHCAAIAFPLDRVGFVGINPPNLPAEFQFGSGGGSSQQASSNDVSVSGEKAQAMKGASEVIDHWAEDPHGTGDVLAGKRRQRNPWGVDQMLFRSEEERSRSGVQTRAVGVDMEALAEEAGVRRPWSRADLHGR